MIKVRILDRCEFCDGEAYVFVCEDVDARGDTYDRYRPCEMCHGSGNRAKWVSFLLEQLKVEAQRRGMVIFISKC